MNRQWNPLFDNPYALQPSCATCNDLRAVGRADYSSTPCPVCGCSCAVPAKGDTISEQCSGCVKRRDLIRQNWSLHREIPTIQERDLTEKERAQIAEWRVRHPQSSMLTMLGWIEGGRYTPETDKEFLKEEFFLLGEWRDAWNALAPKGGPS